MDLAIPAAFFVAAVLLQKLWIAMSHRIAIGESIKWYGPQGHMKKQGTPSLGGIVALALVPFAAAAICVTGRADAMDAAEIWIFPAAASAIGLLDDALKKFRHSSEGLRSLQKLALQIVVTAIWGWAVSYDGLYITHSFKISRAAAVPLLIFLGTGFMNAVNVTDGLDGLAAGASLISVIGFSTWCVSSAGQASAWIAAAMLLAFLWHNSHPAQLFMGDVGSHLWAGVILSLCVYDRSLIMIFPLGALFGVEIATVAIQIFAIRRLGRKVFKMSPLHHHFELSGWKETKVVQRFLIAHFAGMVIVRGVLDAYI